METAKTLLLLTLVLQILPDVSATDGLHYVRCNGTGEHPKLSVKAEFSSSIVDNGKIIIENATQMFKESITNRP